MHGTIKLESELGKGSTFTVTLPRFQQAQPKLAA
jgi:signal transduction histidine kinase